MGCIGSPEARACDERPTGCVCASQDHLPSTPRRACAARAPL